MSRHGAWTGRAAWRAVALAGALVGATGLLAGCGGGEPASAPVASTKPAAAADASVDPAVAEATKRTTAALTVGRAVAPVEVRFAVGAAPRVGQPVDVELALITQVAVPTVRVDVRGAADVQVVDPAATVSLEKVQAGTLHTIPVRAVPARDGTTTLTVAVTLQQPTGPESRTFQLPIVVGRQAPAG
jgi:hypothetical protein